MTPKDAQTTSRAAFALRMDADEYEKLKAVARREGRTINKEIEYVLRLYLRDYEAEHGEVKP